MATFEIVILFDSKIAETELDKLVFAAGEFLTAETGEVLLVEDWGTTVLEYNIGEHKSARHIMLLVSCTTEELSKCLDFMRIQPKIIRFLDTPTAATNYKTTDDVVTNDAFDTMDASIYYAGGPISNEQELKNAVIDFMNSIGYRMVPFSTTLSLRATKGLPKKMTANKLKKNSASHRV